SEFRIQLRSIHFDALIFLRRSDVLLLLFAASASKQANGEKGKPKTPIIHSVLQIWLFRVASGMVHDPIGIWAVCLRNIGIAFAYRRCRPGAFPFMNFRVAI